MNCISKDEIIKSVCTFHELYYDTYLGRPCRYIIDKICNKNGSSYEIVACQICGNTRKVNTSNFAYWKGYRAYTCSQKCSGKLKTKREIIRGISVLILMKWYTREELCKMFDKCNDTMANTISFAYKYRSNNRYVQSLIEHIINHNQKSIV